MIYPKISKNQYGFKPSSSTINNLLFTYSTIYKYMDKGIPSDLITIDYTKAFDKIDIDLLINKLSKYYHISPSFCQLIQSLHSERIQLVSYKNTQSDPLPISGGLLQGSILSSLLIIAFINDLFDE